MKNKKIDEYILYIFLNKLYSFYDDNLDTSIFNNITKDYISNYKLAFMYIINKTKDINYIFKFINYYYKNNKEYPEEFRISKISLKTIRLIINNEEHILKENNDINDDYKSIFIYKKAKEFLDVYDNKKHMYIRK